MPSAASLAIVGAAIRTLDPGRPGATAVSCRDGVILAVGSDAEVRETCDGATEVLDGAGLVITPGLVDAHIHPFFIEQTRGADLTRCATLAELADALRAEQEAQAEGEWVLGWGLEYNVFGTNPITHGVLTEALGDVPAYVGFMDQHTAVATPRALQLAGAGATTRFGEAAEIVTEDGIPTGELRELPALDLVRAAIPPLSAAAARERAVASLRRLNAVGLTGAHVMDGSPATFDLVRDLEASGELTVRLRVPLWQKPEMTVDEFRAQLPLAGERGRLWQGGVAKFFIDGVIDSGTAWLYEPDAQGGGTDPFWPDPEAYAAAVSMFAGAGFQCVTHAVGDYAVHAALEAYRPAARAAAPHRIEHIETLHPSDLPRFAAEGVAASMQPLHMQWRAPDGKDSWTRRLAGPRADRAFPTRSLLETGAVVALGSDWPVAQSDPRIGMAWAVLRRPAGAAGHGAFEPEQRMTPAEALHGYTAGAAAVAGELGRSGIIRPGGRADLTGFGADPLAIGPDELPELPVALTVVDGRVVHRAER